MEPLRQEVRDRAGLGPDRGAAHPQRRPEKLTSVAGATILLLVVILAAAATKSFRDLARANAREDELSSEIAETESRVEVLRTRIQDLHDDPIALERLAREDLGLASPEDIVIVLPEAARD